jgi:hypothetical protein
MTQVKKQPLSSSDLDKVFDIALVLLGVLGAAVLQYSTAIQISTTSKLFYFRVTTVACLTGSA